MKHTVTLTQEELLTAARYFYNVHPQAEIAVAAEKHQDDGWISNIGNNECWHPDTLYPNTRIEIKTRVGSTKIGFAGDWDVFWCDDHQEGDIVAYRVIK